MGSVGQRKLFLRHQWALVCAKASVRRGGACTNTPTHEVRVTDAFLCSVRVRSPTGLQKCETCHEIVIIENEWGNLMRNVLLKERRELLS